MYPSEKHRIEANISGFAYLFLICFGIIIFLFIDEPRPNLGLIVFGPILGFYGFDRDVFLLSIVFNGLIIISLLTVTSRKWRIIIYLILAILWFILGLIFYAILVI
jgi:hypothetical protein